MKKIIRLFSLLILVLSFVLFSPKVMAAFELYSITLNVTGGYFVENESSSLVVEVRDGEDAVVELFPNEGYSTGPHVFDCDYLEYDINDNVIYDISEKTLTIENVTSEQQAITCSIEFGYVGTTDPAEDPSLDPVDEPNDEPDNTGNAENPKTADAPFYAVVTLGIICLAFGIYLFKKSEFE